MHTIARIAANHAVILRMISQKPLQSIIVLLETEILIFIVQSQQIFIP